MHEKLVSTTSLKSMAEKIHFVSFDVVKFQDKEMRSHWYRYDAVDLYYFEKTDGDIVKINVNIFGQFMEWNPYDGLRTGVIVEEEKGGEVYEATQYDPELNESTRAQAQLILENAFQIETAKRQALLICLQKEHKISAWKRWLHRFRQMNRRRF